MFTTTMNQTMLTVPQRKALVALLAIDNWSDGLWKSAKKTYEDTRSKRKTALIRESLKPEMAELIDTIESCRKEIDAQVEQAAGLESQLLKRGLVLLDDGDVSLTSKSPLSKTVEKRLDEELGSTDEVLTRPFESARARLWTVATAEEAERILEPFLKFAVKGKIN